MFFLITSPALAVALAPLLSVQDYLVWAGVIIGVWIYVHAEYHEKVSEAVNKRSVAFLEKGAESGIRTTEEAVSPKKWLDYTRYFFLTAFFLTFLQIVSEALYPILSTWFVFFALGVLFFLIGIIETNRVMDVSENHFYRAETDMGQICADLIGLSMAMLSIRLLVILLPVLPSFPDPLISYPYGFLLFASVFASPFFIGMLHPFPNRAWVKAAFILFAPYLLLGLFYLALHGGLPS